MEIKTFGLVARASDYKEYDKILRLITPLGIINATIKGVKKPKAKLKPSAVPFAFYEYNLIKKGNVYTVSSATQIEDLFSVTLDEKKFQASSIILETALNSFIGESSEQFIYLLHRLKDIIYSNLNPYIYSIKFIQYIIHSSGYGYEYKKNDGSIDSSIKLLSHLYFSQEIDRQIEEALVISTLNKIIKNFEDKFECKILSKSNLFI